MGLLQENGPCFIGNDSNSTYLNPWSWNNEVNMYGRIFLSSLDFLDKQN